MFKKSETAQTHQLNHFWMVRILIFHVLFRWRPYRRVMSCVVHYVRSFACRALRLYSERGAAIRRVVKPMLGSDPQDTKNTERCPILDPSKWIATIGPLQFNVVVCFVPISWLIASYDMQKLQVEMRGPQHWGYNAAKIELGITDNYETSMCAVLWEFDFWMHYWFHAWIDIYPLSKPWMYG